MGDVLVLNCPEHIFISKIRQTKDKVIVFCLDLRGANS